MGADLAIKNIRITLGVGYSWGREEDKNLTEVLRENNEDFRATFVGQGFRLLFGIEFGMKEKNK